MRIWGKQSPKEHQILYRSGGNTLQVLNLKLIYNTILIKFSDKSLLCLLQPVQFEICNLIFCCWFVVFLIKSLQGESNSCWFKLNVAHGMTGGIRSTNLLWRFAFFSHKKKTPAETDGQTNKWTGRHTDTRTERKTDRLQNVIHAVESILSTTGVTLAPSPSLESRSFCHFCPF